MVKKRTSSAKSRSAKRKEAEEIKTQTSRAVSTDRYAYEIRLKDHLERYWAEWFDGWTITNVDNDEVILVSSSTDHAGLHGVLDKIRDLNLNLISVKRVLLDLPGCGEQLEQGENKKL